MLVLNTITRPYAWGRIDGMTDLVGAPATGAAQAELWVGTHPGAPSTVMDGTDRSLAEVVASDPVGLLGAELAAKGLEELPFLLKVLAIGSPLSLQAHPSAAQAASGFAREEAAGIPLAATERTYRDDQPKPEALVAILPTWALCGFRSPEDARALTEALGIDALAPLAACLAGASPLAEALGWMLRLDGAERDAVVDGLARAVPPDATAPVDPFDPSSASSCLGWIARLQAGYPGDPSALAPLFVNLVHLDPGDAVHLPAGNLHAYLDGAGVEVMAASDNVLRGGLTPKHIDVEELLAILHFQPGVPPAPEARRQGPVTVFDAHESAFGLTTVDPSEQDVDLEALGPTLLLATGGPVTVHTESGDRVVLDAGRAAFVGGDDGTVTVSGPGRLWWATTGDALPF